MSRRTVVCGLILIVALHFYYQNYCQIVHNPFKPKDTNIVCHKHALSDNTKLTRILKTIFSRKEHLFSLRALGMRGVKVYWIGDHYLKDFEKPNLHWSYPFVFFFLIRYLTDWTINSKLYEVLYIKWWFYYHVVQTERKALSNSQFCIGVVALIIRIKFQIQYNILPK